MATTTTLRPIVPTYPVWPAPSGWTITGGSASFAAATGLTGDSDATYLTCSTKGSGTELPFQMGAYSLPANSFNYSISPRVRVRRPTGSGGTLNVKVTAMDGTQVSTGGKALTYYPRTVTVPTNSGGTAFTTYTIPALLIPDVLVTSWKVAVYFNGTAGAALSIVEVYLDVVSHTLGAVTFAAPATPVTGTVRPTVDSTVTDPEGDGPGQVRVVYDSATYGAPGFDPWAMRATDAVYGWSDALSGAIGSAQQYVGFQDLEDGVTYRVYAWPKYGAGIIAPVTQTFLVDLANPIAPTVTAAWDDTLQRAVVTVAGHGNQLTGQQATMEDTGTTGFTVGTNCTLARSTAQAKSGSASLAVTATAGATFNVRVTPTGTFTDYVPVDEATAYTFTASSRAAVTARGVTLGLAWYDGSGSLLSTTTGASTNDASGSWTTLSITATSPSSALYVVPIITWATAAAAEVHYVDELALYPGVAAGTVNLLADDKATFEAGVTSLNNSFSSSTLTVSGVRAQHGTKSVLCTWGNGTGGHLAGCNFTDLNPGTTYTLSAYVWVVSGSAVSIGQIFGPAPSSSSTPAGTTAATSGTGSWQRLGYTFTATSSTHHMGVFVPGTANLTGQSAHVDAVQLEVGSAATTFGVSSPAWSVGGIADPEVIIERSADAGATWTVVRPTPGSVLGDGGGTAVTMAGQVASVYDYEAPRGGTVLYRSLVRSTFVQSGGVLPSAYSANASVTTTNDGSWWMKAPLDPALNVGGAGVLRVVKGSLAYTVEEDLGTFRPLGRSLAVVVAGDLGGEDGTLELTALGAVEWDDLLPVLTYQGPILLQDPDGTQKYVRCNAPRDWRRDAGAAARRTVPFPYVEVDAP